MAESTEDQAFRSMLECGWKNIGRKGSRSKMASTISKSLEESTESTKLATTIAKMTEPTKSIPSAESCPGKDVSATTSVSSMSVGSSSHKLGSWGKLLSKTFVAEPETVVETADVVPETSPTNDEEVTEAMLEDPETDAVVADVVEEAYPEEDFPEAACDEIADVDELMTEGMDVEEGDEAQEVTEGDVLGEETAVQEDVADEMEEEEAAALAALEGKVSSAPQKSEPPKGWVTKPVIAKLSKVSGAKPAVPNPVVAKMPSDVQKPKVVADEDDDCCIIDDDDAGNTAGAEFREALDDLPSGKVMKTLAKAQIRPNAKPPAGAPPKATGNTPAKAGGWPEKKTSQMLPPVRTPSGNLGQPPKCKNGHFLKLFRNDGGYNCDNCSSLHTTHRCSAGCDFDLCQKCFFDQVHRAAQGKPIVATNVGKAGNTPNANLRTATPIIAGKPGNTPKAGIQRTTSGSITPLGNSQQSKPGSITPSGNSQQNKPGSITPLIRANSGISGQANSPKGETQISGGKIIRTNSGNFTPLVRTNSGNAGKGGTIQPVITPSGGEIKRINSVSILPAGGDLKRTNSGGVITPQGGRNKTENAPKRARTDTGPIAGVDGEGRRYNLNSVVVNFANVGASYAKKVLKRDGELNPQTLFDWEGVRRSVNYLGKNLGLKVIGVIYENFWATDNDSKNKVELPNDIRRACESIEETPRIVGKNHGSADDEMTIKCAYHRNCRFMDNDNYRDWKQQLRDEKCRTWLEKCQDLLHMRYYFDSSIGVFETLDGNVPPGLLAPDGVKIPMAGGKQTQDDKRSLWTASNR